MNSLTIAIPNSTNLLVRFNDRIVLPRYSLDNNHFEIRFMVFFAIKCHFSLYFRVLLLCCNIVLYRDEMNLFLCSINNLDRVRLLWSLIDEKLSLAVRVYTIDNIYT